MLASFLVPILVGAGAAAIAAAYGWAKGRAAAQSLKYQGQCYIALAHAEQRGVRTAALAARRLSDFRRAAEWDSAVESGDPAALIHAAMR